MGFSKIHSAQPSLLKAHIIDIEIDVSKKGLHSFSIVGLPDKAVEEARDRVSSAIKNSGFKSPKEVSGKIVASLAPADVKKEGSFFDVGIALGYLLATEEISFDSSNKIFFGELALDGNIRRVAGALPLTKLAKEMGFSEIFVPEENATESALIDGISIYPCKNLKDLIRHLKDDESFHIKTQEQTIPEQKNSRPLIDFSEIQGNTTAKRGLEIAAAGGHNICMFGPPGTGKTMLARAFQGLLPELSIEEALEVTSIHSVAGILKDPLITQPPFRAPHHTSSHVSLVGGGAVPKPGEVTLAHRGVLFLDEFPEFDRRVIESLRQPLEDRVISISRSKGTAIFPADIILIAAMNPCPCGNFGSQGKRCVCTPQRINQYQRKISGPIVDRIDMWVEVDQIDHNKLLHIDSAENTESIKRRINSAREKQKARFNDSKMQYNAHISGPKTVEYLKMNSSAEDILNSSAKKFDMSARSYHRLARLARTIADLEQKDRIEDDHILEALQYRPKELIL